MSMYGTKKIYLRLVGEKKQLLFDFSNQSISKTTQFLLENFKTRSAT